MALTFMALFLIAAAPAAALTVEDCVRLALARSPAVRAALADARGAAALVRSARAAYWPSLAAKGDYGVSKGFDRAVTNGGQTDALVSLGATLLDGGLRDARLAAAQASLRSATAKEMQQRADVVFAVRAAFFQAVAAESALAIQDDDIRMLRAYVALLERQEARGIVPHSDVLRAELAVQAAETARRASAADSQTARGALAILAGVDARAGTLEEPDVRFVPPREEAVEAAPVIVDARATAETAHREVDAVRSERRSQLKLTADGGALGVRPGPTFRANGGGQFLLGFTLPVFAAGLWKGRGGDRDRRGAARPSARRPGTSGRDQRRPRGHRRGRGSADPPPGLTGRRPRHVPGRPSGRSDRRRRGRRPGRAARERSCAAGLRDARRGCRSRCGGAASRRPSPQPEHRHPLAGIVRCPRGRSLPQPRRAGGARGCPPRVVRSARARCAGAGATRRERAGPPRDAGRDPRRRRPADRPRGGASRRAQSSRPHG